MARSTRGALATLAALVLTFAATALPLPVAPASAAGATGWACSVNRGDSCTVTGSGTIYDLTWTTALPWAPGGDCGGNAPQGCPAAVMTLGAPYVASPISAAQCTDGVSKDYRSAGLNWSMYFYYPLPSTVTCHISADLSNQDPSQQSGFLFQIWNMTHDDATQVTGYQTTPVTRALTISNVAISPDAPTTGDSGITATVTVRNDTPDTITNVTAGLTSSTTGVVTAGAVGPPSVGSLASGASTDFTVPLTAVAPGAASLNVTASATDGADTLTATPRTRTFTLTGSGVTVALSADPSTPHTDQAVTITAKLTNATGRTLTGLGASLTPVPATVDIGAPAPTTVPSLDAGASTTIRWTVTAHQATSYAFSAATSWTDPVDGPGSSTTPFTLAVSNDAIVVNSTADSVLTTRATENHYCDVDDFTPGDQCTLRAAIQTADALGAEGGVIAIGFDVPGRTPTIAPASALPAITAKVMIDGTTQSGGWVRLSGGSAGGVDGLSVTGGGSTIRGLVLGGWRTAIALTGAGDDTVVGNRIGTDIAGSTADPNTDGVLVQAPGVRIGALTSDGSLVCQGDCNVISGNTHDGVTNGASDTLPARLQVVGNLIGTDATGEAALLNGQRAVDLNWTTDPTAAGDAVQIGGSTSRAGLAPGNLIDGTIWSVRGGRGQSEAPVAGIRIQGDLIGADWTGTRALQRVEYGVAITGSPHDVVGGSTAAEGNTIVGTETGISVSDAVVDHNIIGVGLDGRAIPNDAGVIDDAGFLCNNVISGNRIGVRTGAYLAGGNRIGTDATGTRAIPNAVGVGNGTHSVLTAFCPSTSFDVISGNGTGVKDDSGLSLQRVLIGTDPSGIVAVPNGVGITGAVATVQMGGPEPTLDGFSPCAYPCVVVAGNTGAGIDLSNAAEASTSIQLDSVAVGVGLDGRALANGPGPGVRFSGIYHGNPGGIVNSTIAHTTGPAVELDGTPEAQGATPFTITGSTISDAPTGMLIADGSRVRVSGTTIHDVATGIQITGGATAPELTANSMYRITSSPYQYPATTKAIGTPGRLSAVLTGNVVTVDGDAPSTDVTSFRVDVFGETDCSAASAGLYPLGSFDTTVGLLETGTGLQGRVVVPAALRGTIGGILVTATDTSVAAFGDTFPRTGHYTRCVPLQNPPASASASASSAAPGATVTVTGSGFAPGEPVRVELHSDPVLLATVPADASGAVSARVTIPSSTPPGAHHLVLVGTVSGVTASVPITITATAAAALADGALARTGTDPSGGLAAGIGLLVLGALALAFSRRGRSRSGG